jgi:hypothetical protein
MLPDDQSLYKDRPVPTPIYHFPDSAIAEFADIAIIDATSSFTVFFIVNSLCG